MKSRLIILTILYSVALSSCKKKGEEETYARVTIFDDGVQRYLQNRKVKLMEFYYKQKISINDGPYYDTYSTILKEGVTDANGQYDFGVFYAKRDRNYSYEIRTDENIMAVNKGERNTINFIQHNNAFVDINFLPPPPYNIGDTLGVDFYDPIYNHHYKLNEHIYSEYSRHFSVHPGTFYLNINKYKSGVYTNTKDTVLFDVDTTLQYNIYW